MARIPDLQDLLRRAILDAKVQPSPVAPGMDREGAPPIEDLAVLEHQSHRRFTPERIPSPKLVEFDEQAADIEARKQALSDRLADLRRQLANAPALDAERTAEWMDQGERGHRPEPTGRGLERKIEEASTELAAADVRLTRCLDDKTRYVEKHRKALVRRADDEADRALARALDLVAELEQTRDVLAACRRASVWAATMPHADASQSLPTHQLAGATVPPLQRAGLNHGLEAKRTYDLLRDDLEWLRTAATPAQRALMEGRDMRPGGALWVDSDEGRAHEKAEKQAALRRYRELWGRDPA